MEGEVAGAPGPQRSTPQPDSWLRDGAAPGGRTGGWNPPTSFKNCLPTLKQRVADSPYPPVQTGSLWELSLLGASQALYPSEQENPRAQSLSQGLASTQSTAFRRSPLLPARVGPCGWGCRSLQWTRGGPQDWNLPSVLPAGSGELECFLLGGAFCVALKAVSVGRKFQSGGHQPTVQAGSLRTAQAGYLGTHMPRL